jgi:hypothetical protein
VKTCSKCGAQKDESEYFFKDKKSGRLHAECKACYKEHRATYYAAHYEKNKAAYQLRAKLYRAKKRQEFQDKILTYLRDKQCAVCGESDVRVLEFDHLDPALKQFGISQAYRLGISWEVVLEEIGKCRVLCANCHKRHTAEQFNWYKNSSGAVEAPTGIEPV